MAIDVAAPLVAAVALKTTCLFAIAMAVTKAMRRASAASRYRVWIATLTAAGLVPIAAATLPPVAVRVLAPTAPVASMPSLQPAGPKPPVVVDSQILTPIAAGSVPVAPRAPERSRSGTEMLLALWLGGFLALALRQLRGALSAHRLVRACDDAPSDVGARARAAAVRLGLGRRVRIRIADASIVPMTSGALSLAIVLPRVSRDWSRERLDAVLTHELAHCVRLDTLTDQIAQAAVALWWWHPLAWVALHRARLDRERACDDHVLAGGRRASDYAEDLVSIIETLASPKAAIVAAGRRSHLEQRVHALLDMSINRRRASWASLGLATLVVALSLAGASTQLAARAAATLRPKAVDIALAGIRIDTRSSTAGSMARRSIASAAVARDAASPQATTPAMTPADPQWRAERAAMFQALIDRANQHIQNVADQVYIGTMAQLDTLEPQRVADSLRRDAAADAHNTGTQSGAERAVTKARFDESMRDLHKVETRFMVGLSNVRELDAALLAAADVLRKPPSAIPTGWDQPLSDAALASALHYVASMPDEAARTEALLTLAQHSAFSPDAVALYVQTAGALTSTTDRTRVFAQLIRVKPAGGG